jgi:hypothetical protein
MSTTAFFDKLGAVRGTLTRHSGAPTAFREIQELLRDEDVRRVFLSELDRPEWIATLRSANYFRDPPATEETTTGTRFPPWPQSGYLAKMAVRAPADVSVILSEIETDNALVVDDAITAALCMPAVDAARIVPLVCRAARQGRLWNGFEKASDLCIQIAEADDAESAIALAGALFAPRAASTDERSVQRDLYWYANAVKKVAPVLARQWPLRFLAILCDWLNASVDAKSVSERGAGFDHSYAWRPAIEENEQNSDYDFAGVMVGVVRAGFEEAIRAGLSLSSALNVIGRYHYLVFKRLRIHLVNEFADQDAALARATILNHDLFDDYKFRHEYGLLVGVRFELLRSDEREQWFGWIDAGPDMTDFEKSVEENVGRAATEKDRQGRIDYWKFEKLHWVRKHLDGDRTVFYERMMAENGEPKLAYFVVWSGPARWGWESPKTVGELTGMTFADALAAVSSWTPTPGDTDGPNVEGLATTFEQFVGTNPAGFSAESRLLIGRPAHFARPFITKMCSALSSEANVDVGAVFDLCRWIIAQPTIKSPIDIEGADGVVGGDWQWVRSEVSRLLRALCGATTAGAPKYKVEEFRKPVWNLISALCGDPADSAISFDFNREDPRVNDYLDLGINSARGKAIEAALEYARWVGNHLKQTVNGKEIVPGGFNSMPELREILEAQITSGNRRFEVLSIVGSHISLIYWIDKDWLAASARRIFRLEDIENGVTDAQGWAAWNAFLVWQAPHIEFYQLFKEQFAYAVTQAAKVQPTERGRQQPMNHLGEHLMILYGRGQLAFDDDGGLLRRFLDTANPEIRRHAFRFIGLTLESSEHVPVEILSRFQELWLTYWAGTGKADAREKPGESSFGDWFTSEKFPDQWALEQLERFQEIVPVPAPDYEIVERLANIAPTDPARSARILDKMVRSDKEGWRAAGWLESATKILKVSLAAGGEAETVALTTIDFLGRSGYVAVGELLQKQN